MPRNRRRPPAAPEQPLARVQAALSRLRDLESVDQVLAAAPVALCAGCGFDRAIFSRLEQGHLVARAAYFKDSEDWAAQILKTWQRTRPELTHMIREADLIRRGMAGLISDPQNDPGTFKPLVHATQTRSYVAAPVMPSGRVVGFLHADRLLSEDDVGELDRLTIAAFAEGFGFAAERAVLLERLNFQRRHLRQVAMEANALATELARGEIELGAVGGSPELAFGESQRPHSTARLKGLLTDREIDVLELMAAGATNAQIADRLVIAPGTVKSHVKHILRKLRAANRAEAVSKFMQLSKR